MSGSLSAQVKATSDSVNPSNKKSSSATKSIKLYLEKDPEILV